MEPGECSDPGRGEMTAFSEGLGWLRHKMTWSWAGSDQGLTRSPKGTALF